MSKKNSSVILKNEFKNFKDLSHLYLNFKNKLKKFKVKSSIIAISGGPDSLALAALTKAYCKNNKGKFFYVLVNHNIRKNSDKEAYQVKDLLKKYKISLKILTNKKIINKNIQGEARKIRYELLTKFCIKKKVKTIITAHNFEDQVETFFIRLSRGSGLTGLSAMKPLINLNQKVKLFRPLLDTKKVKLKKLSKIVFGKYFSDPSNKDKKYLRTRIRHLKKPLIQSGISYDNIFKSINNLASSKKTLDEYFSKIYKATIIKVKNKIFIDLNDFIKYNPEIKLMIINESIKRMTNNYYHPRSKKVFNLIKNIETLQIDSATLGGCLFSINKGTICIKKEKK